MLRLSNESDRRQKRSVESQPPRRNRLKEITTVKHRDGSEETFYFNESDQVSHSVRMHLFPTPRVSFHYNLDFTAVTQVVE
jgi:hypothetical protein